MPARDIGKLSEQPEYVQEADFVIPRGWVTPGSVGLCNWFVCIILQAVKELENAIRTRGA